ncbi:putative monooxygenase [Microdochium bolleyi]|uniref:Putative monooxygenase n=1 Tax=Microdochium bolleyi TaxID=196109 RepID=A0A136IJM0_9PEZI|nr:putative monooxygenase [Microdochium bolleyi]
MPYFRVIIVGAGLVGLTAAHILYKAGIDFVVLEKHKTIIPTVGSVMTIWPQTSRVFQQLGLNEVLSPHLDSLQSSLVISAKDAQQLDDANLPGLIEQNHGWGLRILLRTQFVKELYNSLPPTAKSRIHLGREVEGVSMDEISVRVTCKDGSTEEGSIIIGADGVRSQTRLLMEALRQHKEPHDLDQRYQRPFMSTYRVLVSQIEQLPGASTNVKCDSVHYGVTTQFLQSRKVSCFAIYEKLQAPSSERRRYTEADKLQIRQRWKHLMVMPGYSVGDLHDANPANVGLYDCEEGLVSKWYHKRIVLVGDAVRKLDPHTGMGYNEGVTDLVVLINGIRHMLHANHSNRSRTVGLEEILSEYERLRLGKMAMVMQVARTFARMAGWLSWKDMVMAKYVQPYLGLSKLCVTHILGPMISKSPVLDWIQEPQLPQSAIEWKYRP